MKDRIEAIIRQHDEGALTPLDSCKALYTLKSKDIKAFGEAFNQVSMNICEPFMDDVSYILFAANGYHIDTYAPEEIAESQEYKDWLTEQKA